MNELRNTISSTPIPRTGVVVVTQVLDLETLGRAVSEAKEAGREVDQAALEGAGSFLVTLEKAGSKPRQIAKFSSGALASAFAHGFKACADVRRVQNRKPAKRKAAAE